MTNHTSSIEIARFNHALRETGELVINIPALPRPTIARVQAKYPYVRSIEQDTSPEGPVTLVLATVLRGGESRISGQEYELRLQPSQVVLLGFQHREWLLEHQDEIPALRPLLGEVFLDFPGIVVVSGSGARRGPCVEQSGERWRAFWYWLGCNFCSNGRVAVSGA